MLENIKRRIENVLMRKRKPDIYFIFFIEFFERLQRTIFHLSWGKSLFLTKLIAKLWKISWAYFNLTDTHEIHTLLSMENFLVALFTTSRQSIRAIRATVANCHNNHFALPMLKIIFSGAIYWFISTFSLRMILSIFFLNNCILANFILLYGGGYSALITSAMLRECN